MLRLRVEELVARELEDLPQSGEGHRDEERRAEHEPSRERRTGLSSVRRAMSSPSHTSMNPDPKWTKMSHHGRNQYTCRALPANGPAATKAR